MSDPVETPASLTLFHHVGDHLENLHNVTYLAAPKFAFFQDDVLYNTRFSLGSGDFLAVTLLPRWRLK